MTKRNLRKNNEIAKSEKEEILKQYKLGKSCREIAREYDCNKQIIYDIIGKNNIRSLSESMSALHKRFPQTQSESSRANLREKRLQWMKNNPEKTAWRNTNMSYPEKVFFEHISKDERFVIEREKSFFPYYADFTILNANIVIEVDGSQHINRKEIDEAKEKLIISKGYRVIRFTASHVQNNIIEVLEILDKFVSSDAIIEKVEYLRKISEKEELQKQIKLDRENKIQELNNKRIQLVLTSDINFKKLGWMARLSPIIGIRSTKIRYWMKKYMPEFYNNCYQRLL